GIEAEHVAAVGLLGRERADRLPFLLVGREEGVARAAVEDVRELPGEVVPSWTPQFPPKPPVGGMTCAESPARKIRPSRSRAAYSADADQRWTFSISTAISGSPSASRT